MAPLVLLQGNLNHSRGAQDLMVHALREHGAGLAVMAEPHSVPAGNPDWVGDLCGLVVAVRCAGSRSPPLNVIERGNGFVAVVWDGTAVIGLYAPPSHSLARLEQQLDEVRRCVVTRYLPRPLLVLGDFNAHATAWGSPRTNSRGEAVLDWAAGLGLRLLNRGSRSTCVRWQGESIVDLSWSSAAAERRVSGWRVSEEENLSDHRYILMEYSSSGDGQPPLPRPNRPARLPRWAVRRLDADLMAAAVRAVAWSGAEPTGPVEDVGGEAVALREAVTHCCDTAMPRAGPVPPRRAAYWWSDEIARLRAECMRARRQYVRSRRRRRRDEARTALLRTAYHEVAGELRKAIARAKSRAWDELLAEVERDPWGRPYRLVMGRLRGWAPPITETLDPHVLERVTGVLFPAPQGGGRARPAPAEADPITWSAEMGVTEEELAGAVRKMTARNTAPGPDGIPGKAWGLASAELGHRLRGLFDTCLRTGTFPAPWKVAQLVLLRKEGRPADAPSGYRPICLLGEDAKLFERILAGRLTEHLSRVGPDLADSQFGFRGGRSTVDAVARVRALTDTVVAGGGVAMAVSLDIVNAFNTLPHDAIERALVYHRVPSYLCAAIRAYLRDRKVIYTDRDGTPRERAVGCGVPQGSVLGPLLWDVAYDRVLRVALPEGIYVVCYADDTLVVVVGEDHERTLRLAEFGTARVVRAIRELGLEVAAGKTEALWFYAMRGPLGPPPARSWIRLGESCVRVGTSLRYLGLDLDGLWSFREHFARLVPRVEGTAAALGRLMPNIGGPPEKARRLYVGVVASMVRYGSPVWAGDLVADRHSLASLRRLERRLAIRVVRGYRTVSYEAATALAGVMPFDVLAEMDAGNHRFVQDLRRAFGGGQLPPHCRRAVEVRRLQARRLALARWRDRLGGSAGQRAVGAVLANWQGWQDRGHGRLTFRLVQVLAGHGCFGEYLHRIGREDTARCHHCGGDRDSAQHTLEACPAWGVERRVLIDAIGGDLSLPAVVGAMVRDEGSWEAVSNFCEVVISQKEEAERERERADPARRRARRRGPRG